MLENGNFTATESAILRIPLVMLTRTGVELFKILSTDGAKIEIDEESFMDLFNKGEPCVVLDMDDGMGKRILVELE